MLRQDWRYGLLVLLVAGLTWGGGWDGDRRHRKPRRPALWFGLHPGGTRECPTDETV
jgi:hypothetical protein